MKTPKSQPNLGRPVNEDGPADVHSLGRYWRKALSRGAMAWMIRGLVDWKPMAAPEEGYTVLIGCASRLAPLLKANLALLARLDLSNARKILVVVDAAKEDLGAAFEDQCRAVSDALPLEFLYYDAGQLRVARRIEWGWVYSWLSWCKGIAACTTRHAFLHDFDALLLGPRILEERYAAIRERGVQYLGIDFYRGLGIERVDGLARTFELMFDAAHVREHHRPIELFNRVGRLSGKRVEFDTLLYPQARAGRSDVLRLDETLLVHPSQMICQYVDFVAGRGVPWNNNLLMIPYYELLGGDPRLFDAVRAQLVGGKKRPELWGRELVVGRLSPRHAAWMEKQASRLEAVVEGGTRASVAEYFGAVNALAGSEGGVS